MSYKQTFEKHLQSFLIEKNIQQHLIVTYSDYQDYQYQTNLGLILKKVLKDFEPQTIVDFLNEQYGENYESIEVTGNGFISVKFNLEPQEVLSKKQEKIIVDYCGVNVAKQMHIGHIRSMFIGDYVVRLHEALGDEVIIQNHIGDWGNQFGFLLNYILENNLQNNLNNKLLTKYYKLAYLKNEEDEVFAKNSMEIAYNLQNNLDNNLKNLWKELVNISMIEAEKVFKEFNLKMNLSHTQGESFYAPYCKDILNTLVEQKIATKNEDGSVVIFFDKKSPLVLQKSNGNYLYALYDLAALKWRCDTHNPDKIIYVVDKRQSLHFEQVFEAAKKANFVTGNTQLLHLGFGTILGEDKKPLKTKEGKSLYLDELLEQGKEKLLLNEHFLNMPEDIKEEVFNKTIIGGMKYHDLKYNKQQDYVFNWDHVLSFIGNSAPYIQNAIVRIDSIFYKKSLEENNETQKLEFDWIYSWNKLEKEIIFNCQKVEEIIGDNDKKYPSQQITEHAIKLCQLFHKYYESEKILGHENENTKLQLLTLVDDKLKNICEIMGIEYYLSQAKLINQNKKKLSF